MPVKNLSVLIQSTDRWLNLRLAETLLTPCSDGSPLASHSPGLGRGAPQTPRQTTRARHQASDSEGQV